MNNIPGTRPSRTIGLDELAKMTSEIQEAEKTGSLGADGMPLQRVKTVDLTVKDVYNPLEGATPVTPKPVLNTDSIPMDGPVQQYVPPALREKLKQAEIADIAPPAEPRTTETLQEKWIKDLDNALERDKQAQWDNVIMPLYEQELEKKALQEMGVEDEDTVDDDVSAELTSLTSDNDDDGFTLEEDEGEYDMNNSTGFIDPQEYSFEEETQAPVQEPVQEQKITVPSITVEDKVQEATDKDQETEVIRDIVITAPTDTIDDMDLDNIFGEDISSDLEESDDSDADEVELSEDEQKEEITAMQKVIRQEIKPIGKVIDISKFKVASKPINSSKVLANMATNKSVHTANWYLPNAGRPFTMSELGGSEIEKLNPSAETGLSELMRNRERYGIFYDHIIDANKPASFEAWAKTIPYDDVKALYYGAYRASFSHGSNLLPYYCDSPKCKHSFMQHKPIDSMVRFADDDAKDRAKKVMAMDPSGLTMSLESRIFQVSDDICISFHTPSIYNVEFEIPVLPKKFREKYEELMYYISCIEDIYQIDHNNGFLIKMATKAEPDNIAKTVANKYKAYAAILQRLTADQYYSIYSYIKEVKEDHSAELIFEYPEVTCPKCGKVIKAAEMDPMQMLFTRLRLPTILVL